MLRVLIWGLLLIDIGYSADVAAARVLSVNRAYTGGGNSQFAPGEVMRRTITADRELYVTGTTDVEIQEQLNEARVWGLDNPGTTTVVILTPLHTYDLGAPLVIHGNTVLEGGGAILRVAPNVSAPVSRMVTIRGDSSGIHSCDFRAESQVTRAAVVVVAGATNTAIFDNWIDGGDESSAPQLIDVEQNVTNLEIDGNQLVNMTNGILLGREGIVNAAIRHNQFASWHDRAIFVKNRSFQAPLATIDVYGNLIGMPDPRGIVRQPIAFQSDTVGGSQIRDVRIRHNKILGNDQPYIVGQQDDFSAEDEIVRIGNTEQYRLLNGAAADMISLQDVAEFDIFANRLESGGEAGVNVTRGSRNGQVRWNSIEGQDTVGINLGSNLGANSPASDPLRVSVIDVFRNSMINPGRNRADPTTSCNDPAEGDDDGKDHWTRSGISVQFADDVTLRHNYIEETQAVSDTVCYGVYSHGHNTNLFINAPTFDFVSEGVIWNPRNSSSETLPLEFERLIGDANLDGVVDDADVCTVIKNLFQPGTWDAGDFSGDGFVDAVDFDLLLLNLYREANYRPAPGRSDDGPRECSYELIDFENFEAGWGIWNDGGSDCTRDSSAKWAASGSHSIRIRDDSSSSMMTTDVLDLADQKSSSSISRISHVGWRRTKRSHSRHLRMAERPLTQSRHGLPVPTSRTRMSIRNPF